MYPATRVAKANPESNLRKWFVSALTEFRGFVDFFNSITEEDLRGFWCRRKFLLTISEAIQPREARKTVGPALTEEHRCSVSIYLVWKLSHLPLPTGI